MRPQLINRVEECIGLPLFSNSELGEQVRINPLELPAEVFQPRAVIFLAGLRLVFSKPNPDIPAEAYRRQQAVKTLRAELMLIDPDLEPPVVKDFRIALDALKQQAKLSRTTNRTRERDRPTDQLPAWCLPIQSATLIVNRRPDKLQSYAASRGLEFFSFNLPGNQRTEYCLGWDIIKRQAEEDKVGLRPGMAEVVDFDKLPRSKEDDDPERLDYARQLQLQLVPHHKLQNIPELVPHLNLDLAEAKSYHVTRTDLGRLMDGGYDFVDEYCRKHGIAKIPLKMGGWRGQESIGYYLLIEEAAGIWDAYKQIPRATNSHVSIRWAAAQIGVDARFFRNSVPDDALVEDMRAIKPKGQVSAHILREVALAVMERLQRNVLPPHRVPIRTLDKYFAHKFKSLTRPMAAFEKNAAKLRLHGSDREQSCYTWETVGRMEYQRQVPLLDPDFQLDYDRLPVDEYDLDPERIAYARLVQAKLVDHPEQVDQTPIEEYIAAQRKKLGIAEPESAPEPAQHLNSKTEVPPVLKADAEPEPTAEPPTPHADNATSNKLPESGIRHDPEEVPDTWQPRLSIGRSARLARLRMTAPEMAILTDLSVAEVRDAIRRVNPGNTSFSSVQQGGQNEIIYETDMLTAVLYQLTGVPLVQLQGMFQLNDQQLENARQHLASLGYRIFEGDICSPAAFQLLCDNAAIFKAS